MGMEQSDRVRDILADLHKISGFRISLHDTMFRELMAEPEEHSHFCRCVQTTAEGRRICVDSDRDAFAQVRQNGGLTVYRCRFGLLEAISPLYHFGVLSGYLMMGQVLPDTAGAAEEAALLASAYVTDGARIKMEKIPVCSDEQMATFARIMTVCAEYLTLSGYVRQVGDIGSRVRDYLHAHYGEHLTLSILANQFGCSRSTLIAAFEKTNGESVMGYLSRLRLDSAKRLLTETDLSVGEIAARCGFRDQGYFSKAFRHEEGASPSEYREEARRGA
jgi:AraC-like DNA-binding protein